MNQPQTFWINDSYTINIGNICGETMQLKNINVKDIVCVFESAFRRGEYCCPLMQLFVAISLIEYSSLCIILYFITLSIQFSV